MFEIKYTANRADKYIGFKTLDGKDGVVNLKGVFIEDQPISKKPTVFIGQGIMDGVLSGATLVLILIQYFEKTSLVKE